MPIANEKILIAYDSAWIFAGLMERTPDGVSLPPKPRPPDESECCNSDCTLCVKDIYEQELKIWEEECKSLKLAKAPRSEMSSEIYAKLKLLDITVVTHNTNLYTFSSNGFVDIQPGQHLILREFDKGSSITRQYTPVAVPQPDDFTFKVLIKLYDGGVMSQIIKERWRVGQAVEWRGPLGMFLHEPNKYTKYLMLAAGTGCAPMLGVARQIVANDADITAVKLLYANRKYEDVLFSGELKELARSWNFTYKHFISQDPDASRKKSYGENVAPTRIKLEHLASELPTPASTRVLICGTRQFDAAMLSYLKQLSVPLRHIFKF